MIDSNKVESGVTVTQDDLQSYYQQHRDAYRVPEQVKVSHILIKTPLPGTDGKVDEKGVAEAQRRAEDLLKQLKSWREAGRRRKEIFRGSRQRERRRIARLDRTRTDCA